MQGWSRHFSTPNNGQWLPPKTGSEATPTQWRCLSTAFLMLLDSKTNHYLSTVADCASLSHQRKSTERSKNATSSCLTAQLIIQYHTYQKCNKCLEQIPPYSRATVVVLSTVLANEKFVTNNNWVYIWLLYNIYVIIASFYIFYASSVAVAILLLKNHQNKMK